MYSEELDITIGIVCDLQSKTEQLESDVEDLNDRIEALEGTKKIKTTDKEIKEQASDQTVINQEQEVADLVKVFWDYDSAFYTNEVMAEDTYIGMPVSTTGEIRRIYYEYDKKRKTKNIIVIIDISETSGFNRSMGLKGYNDVTCYFKPSDIQNVYKLKKRHKSTIRGLFGGVEDASFSSKHIIMSECVVQQIDIPQLF